MRLVILHVGSTDVSVTGWFIAVVAAINWIIK